MKQDKKLLSSLKKVKRPLIIEYLPKERFCAFRKRFQSPNSNNAIITIEGKILGIIYELKEKLDIPYSVGDGDFRVDLNDNDGSSYISANHWDRVSLETVSNSCILGVFKPGVSDINPSEGTNQDLNKILEGRFFYSPKI